MKVDLLNFNGEKKGEIDLNPKIFETKVNPDLIHQAMVMQLANKRIAIAHSKKRGEVKGGAKKPYRQKGTGRARQGSIRNPHFRGGSVTFGPRSNRNFSLRMPKKQRRQALFSSLSAKALSHEIMILEDFDSNSADQNTIKTKKIRDLVNKLKINRKGLFILPEKISVFQKSSRNLPNLKSILVNYLNVYDILTHENIIFLESALPKLEEIFLKK